MRRFALVAALVLAGCGGGQTRTVTVQKTRVVQASGARSEAFDTKGIYERDAPGVVTIFSGGADGGLGSGFVLNGDGEIATNAHVVTDDAGGSRRPVTQLFVEFADGNRVPGKILGFDGDADVALVKIDPSGLDLHPLSLGNSDDVEPGDPVATIGSPFGERQSISLGVVSAVDRDVDSLTQYSIAGAIQTDAAINPGNSGGPLVDADGKVLGLNQQIESNSGTGSGVGFAVPIDLAKRSLSSLHETGKVEYAYLGVSTQGVYPQLAQRFSLGAKRGAWIQTIEPDGPADAAGLRAGTGSDETFQAESVRPGGDEIVKVGPFDILDPSDLGRAVARLSPGQTVPVVIYRGDERRTVQVKLAKRPDTPPSGG